MLIVNLQDINNISLLNTIDRRIGKHIIIKTMLNITIITPKTVIIGITTIKSTISVKEMGGKEDTIIKTIMNIKITIMDTLHIQMQRGHTKKEIIIKRSYINRR